MNNSGNGTCISCKYYFSMLQALKIYGNQQDLVDQINHIIDFAQLLSTQIPLWIFEPRHMKTCFLHICEKRCRSAVHVTFDFATQIVQSLYFLNQKFQASSHLLSDCAACFKLDLVGNPEDRFSRSFVFLLLYF